MQQLGMVGATYRRGGQAGIERLTLPPQTVQQSWLEMHQRCGFAESVYLATCNRVEVVFACADATPVAQYRQRLFRLFAERAGQGATHEPSAEADGRHGAARALHGYEGEGAVEHLLCVAASLDSMNPGEAQILGQVKDAYHLACEIGTVGPHLTLLFEEAFQAAKRVRASTKLGTRAISMLTLAQGLIEEHLAVGQKSIAVVGAGKMATQCGQSFGERSGVELTFVNRTVAKAQELAEQYGGRARSLSDFLREPGSVDVIVTATSASEPILDEAFFAAVSGEAPLVIDLAIPRDTVVAAATARGAAVYDIDQLGSIAEKNRQARLRDIAAARLIVDDALENVRRRFVEREMAPVLCDLRGRYRGAVDAGLERLLSGPLSSLDESQRRELERWAHAFANRVAHIPTVGLKRLAFDYGMDAVGSYLAGVGGEARATTRSAPASGGRDLE